MSNDEQEIRQLVSTWMKATRNGDTETVLGLMAEDAQFLVAGQSPFGREVFAAAANDPGAAQMQIDAHSDILEITIAGDWAFMVTHLSVAVSVQGEQGMVRAGNTLTVLRKKEGKWLLFRDANLLVPVQQAAKEP